MSKPTVLISLESPIESDPKPFGRRVIETLVHTEERLAPEFLSESERFSERYVGIDDFVENWWGRNADLYVDGRFLSSSSSGPMWKRKSQPAGRGMIHHGGVNLKGNRINSSIWLESRWAKDIAYSSLFDAWVDLYRPSVGMLHLFTDRELSFLNDETGSWFKNGSFGGPAKPGIPNLGWSMAFGSDYAEGVDVAGIKADGFPIDDFGGLVVVRVTDYISDVVDDFPHFSRRRAKLKTFFPQGLFWITEEPET